MSGLIDFAQPRRHRSKFYMIFSRIRLVDVFCYAADIVAESLMQSALYIIKKKRGYWFHVEAHTFPLFLSIAFSMKLVTYIRKWRAIKYVSDFAFGFTSFPPHHSLYCTHIFLFLTSPSYLSFCLSPLPFSVSIWISLSPLHPPVVSIKKIKIYFLVCKAFFFFSFFLFWNRFCLLAERCENSSQFSERLVRTKTDAAPSVINAREVISQKFIFLVPT